MPPLAQANEAAKRARQTRAEWLVSVHQGMVTWPELVEFARTDAGRALRQIKLRRLLIEQDGWNKPRADDAIARALKVLGMSEVGERLTRSLSVGWLLDGRTGFRRIAALSDAIAARNGFHAPCAGFPYRTP